MDAYNFMVQQRTFAVHGYALNPSTSASSSQAVVGSTDVAHENGYSGIDTMRPSKSVRREQKRKRGEKGDAGVVDGDGAYMGPWAAYESERVAEVIEVDPEAEEEWQVEKKRRDEAKEAAQEKMKEAKVEKSIFHGRFIRHVGDDSKTDWQERILRIMLDGRICTFRPIWTSSSIPPMEHHRQMPMSPKDAFTPGYVHQCL